MRRYAYKALDDSGKPVQGELDADTPRDLDQYFADRNWTPLKVAEAGPGAGLGLGSGFGLNLAGLLDQADRLLYHLRAKLLENELIVFTRQFAAAYGAGLNVPRILSMLGGQMTHRIFRESILRIAESIQSGKGLTESFSQYKGIFDTTYLAILNSGEISGNLDAVMNYSAGLLEKKMIHRERIKATLLYPKLVVGAIVFTVIIMLIFVIPQFQKLYDRFGSNLPLPTLILVNLSAFVQSYWWAVILGCIPAYGVIHLLQRNEKFMLGFHRWVLTLPLFGPLFTKVEMTHFCTTFALLIRSGIKVTDATETAVRGMRNSYLRTEMLAIVPALEAGGTLSGSMDKVTVIPALLTSMVAVGEESGNLDGLLDRVASLYDNETEMILKRLPTLLEPVILSVLFVLVLGLALAVYMPMWKLSSLVRGQAG